MPKGPFFELRRTVKYSNRWITVEEATVKRPDGTPGLFGVICAGPGVVVLAIDSETNVLLVEEYRYALDRVFTELVCGGIEQGETPLKAARRELTEETGFSAHRLTLIGAVHPAPSLIATTTYLVLAEEIEPKPGAATLPDPEIIKVVRIPLNDAVKLVLDGTITHAASCVLILRAATILTSNSLTG